MHFLSCFGQGFLTGIALSLMLGTVFFALIRNSLNYGYKSGVYIALGVIISDIIFITFSLLSHGFAVFLKNYELAISVIGGLVLMIMGVMMFLKSNPKLEEVNEITDKNNSAFFLMSKGFLINALNPVNFFSWLAISSMLTIRFDYVLIDKIVFFSASLCSIFLVEFGISFGASKIKPYIKPSLFIIINKISGAIFVLFGLKLALGLFF
ncbi:MAG: LysE family transporter [Bacteroidota bacterium]|nr:LysE family transporter [Bacteroidota bacterium]